MATIDLDAYAGTVGERIATRILNELPAIVRRVFEEQAEHLQPLSTLLSISTRAAGKRIARDPGLRALGVPQAPNRPLLFRASTVTAYFEKKAGR